MSAGSSVRREIHEESPSMLTPSDAEAVVEERVFVAVGKETKESRATVAWAVRNGGRRKIGILHVHQPSQMIPTPMGKFLAHKLTPNQVETYREQERKKMHEILDQYRQICAKGGVESENIVIEMEDIERGILELVVLHGVTMLVMGASADKHYSKKMIKPKSKKAATVSKEAPLTCTIWFICDGKHVCTREASLNGTGVYVTPPSPVTPTSSPIFSPILPRSRTVGPTYQLMQSPNPSPDLLFRSTSETCRSRNISGGRALESTGRSSPYSAGRFDEIDPILSPGSSRSSAGSTLAATDETASTSSAVNGRELPRQVNETADGFESSPPPCQTEFETLDDHLFEQMQQYMLDAENCRRAAYEESVKRSAAEKRAHDNMRKVKQVEEAYQNELKQRKEVEEMLSQETLKLENMRTQHKQALEELENARGRQAELERGAAHSSQTIKWLEESLSVARQSLYSLRREVEVCKREKEATLRGADDLHKRIEDAHSTSLTAPEVFSQFSYLEIEKATQGLDVSFKIGEGGYGNVYKGLIRHTHVAIKLLNPASSQGQSEFQREMEILTRVRHPNLVTLIGTCPEAKALIYEYLYNGSLEDRLLCKHNSPPIPWQLRICILYDVCAALIFLHSVQPHGIVHGDLKPANILLDANFVAKLGDFGISRLMRRDAGQSAGGANTTRCWRTESPRGTIPYIDPEFLESGVLTPKSDVYSFGVVILRVLTGLPALGITKPVKEAVEGGWLDQILDWTAGDWPFVLAQKLICLGLRCCERNRRERPDLESDVWRELEPMMGTAGYAALPGIGSRDMKPSSFICPLFKEIMQDPHVAADGFTYEGEAIKGWFLGGNDASPMTNLKFTHKELIPNRALHSTIQEWLQLRRSK